MTCHGPRYTVRSSFVSGYNTLLPISKIAHSSTQKKKTYIVASYPGGPRSSAGGSWLPVAAVGDVAEGAQAELGPALECVYVGGRLREEDVKDEPDEYEETMLKRTAFYLWLVGMAVLLVGVKRLCWAGSGVTVAVRCRRC